MRTPKARPGQDAFRAVAALYQTHYRSLVRLAALLVSDQATAEEIVQDSFAAVHGSWPTLPDTDAALSYLRRSVILASRSAPRPPLAGGAPAPGRAGDSEHDGLPRIVSALRALPLPEREVMVLRYFADLPEAEIASATGMSTAAVRSHAARAMSSLRAELHPPLNESPDRESRLVLADSLTRAPSPPRRFSMDVALYLKESLHSYVHIAVV